MLIFNKTRPRTSLAHLSRLSWFFVVRNYQWTERRRAPSRCSSPLHIMMRDDACPFSVVLSRADYTFHKPLYFFPHKALTYSILVWFVCMSFLWFASVSSNRSGMHGWHQKRRVRTRAQCWLRAGQNSYSSRPPIVVTLTLLGLCSSAINVPGGSIRASCLVINWFDWILFDLSPWTLVWTPLAICQVVSGWDANWRVIRHSHLICRRPFCPSH